MDVFQAVHIKKKKIIHKKAVLIQVKPQSPQPTVCCCAVVAAAYNYMHFIGGRPGLPVTGFN